MKLLEHRGKELLKACGVMVPPGIVTNNKSYINLSYHKERYREFFFEQQHIIAKAQIISGSRRKKGFIIESSNYAESLKLIDGLYKMKFNGGLVDTLLIERKLNVDKEYFAAIVYDTKERKPMIILSKQGGIDVEKHAKNPATVHVSLTEGLHDFQARSLAKKAGFSGAEIPQIASFLKKLWKCFTRYDCTHCEVNPIIKTKEGLLYAGDAKITIDDNAIERHDVFHDITEIEDSSVLNERELEARKIDVHDYRGVAGKTYFDLDGDIAVLASGGGASLVCMDAIIEAGGKPANYTEYSGNPPKEKVQKITTLALSKKGLKGCLVVGGRANFTDIYETLSGFADGLKAVTPKPKYPIVVRRAGPRDKEAFKMLKAFAKKEGYDITLYGEEMPMTQAAKILVDKI